LEFNLETESWKDYVDPDGEMELDVFPDDGLVHDITSSLSYRDGILWAATYFGLSRFDGVRWRGYFDHDSGLASNFINFVKAHGKVAWICTDKGLNSFDGETWVTYRRDPSGRGEILTTRGTETVARWTTEVALAHNFVNGIDFQKDRIWVATSEGLSLGKPSRRFKHRSE
jgi:ligand-binding sensor domain-containing protein